MKERRWKVENGEKEGRGPNQVHHAVDSLREEFIMLGGLIQQDQSGPDGVASITANKAHRIWRCLFAW